MNSAQSRSQMLVMRRQGLLLASRMQRLEAHALLVSLRPALHVADKAFDWQALLRRCLSGNSGRAAAVPAFAWAAWLALRYWRRQTKRGKETVVKAGLAGTAWAAWKTWRRLRPVVKVLFGARK